MRRFSRATLKWLLILIALISLRSLVHGSPACMTEPEAHKAHPGAPLFWHGRHHCWDATKARAPTIKHHFPRLRYDDAPPDANGNDEAPRPQLLDVIWYTLAFEAAQPMTAPLEPKNYDPTIWPDINASQEIVYASDEFNEMDAAAPPMTSKLSMNLAVLALSCAVSALGVSLATGALLRKRRRWPAIRPCRITPRSQRQQRS
jgi:hypothetical protein